MTGWKPLSPVYVHSSRESREARSKTTNPWLCGAQTAQLCVYQSKANSDGKRCQNEESCLLSHITTYSIYIYTQTRGHYDCLCLTLAVNTNDGITFLGYMLSWTNKTVRNSGEPTRLTQHGADLIGQDRVGVVQPAATTQALSEAVEYRLIGEQHHQDPQSGCDCARV